MTYKNGKRRDDELTVQECMFWMVFYSVIARYTLRVLYRGNYYIPFMKRFLTVWQSRLIYLAFVLINLFVFFIILNVERNFWACIRYGMIPPLISLMVFYSKTYKVIVGIVVLLMLSIIIVQVVIYFQKCKRAEKLHKRLKKKRVCEILILRSYSGIAYIAFLTVVLFIGFAFIIPRFGSRGEVGSVKAASYTTDEVSLMNILDQHKDELLTLQDNHFEKATNDEKLSALQCLLNCMTTYYNIDPITMKMKDMGKYKAGYYDADEHMIYICPEEVEDENNSDEAITTIIHESRHYLQHFSVRYAEENNLDLSLPIYIDIKEWRDNYGNYCEYKGGTDDVSVYMRYRTQPLEADAYSYSENVGILVSDHINGW